MRPANLIQRPSGLMSTWAAGAIFAAVPVFAQNDNDNDDNDNDANTEPAPEPSAEPAPSEPESEPAPAPTSAEPDGDDEEPAPETTAASDEDTEPTSADEDAPENTDEPTETEGDEDEDDTPTSTNESDVVITATGTDTGGAVIITGPSLTNGYDGITDAPSLTRGYGIPEYPDPTVPPTYHAPFMQHSRAPDGTVFIAVGAILGAFALGILLWRGIVSLLLHRSVKRAAMAQHDATSKAGFPAPPAPFYKYTDNGSAMSLGGSAAGRGVRRTNRGPIPSATPSQSNLFFSPTAANSSQPGNRNSGFLPSGFYAAPGGTNSPNHTQSISLTNLRPESRGGLGGNSSRHNLDRTPPDSPAFRAHRDMSSSSLNLHSPPGNQRAPSAYLDDLLADDPSAFPPPHMPPSAGPRNSQGPHGNRF